MPDDDEAIDAVPARERYVRRLLELYLTTPGVLGRLRQADRILASQLYDQRIPLHVVADAFIVAAARRARHNAFSTPLPPIRSLHYFVGTIHELLDRPLGPRDIEELRRALGLAELLPLARHHITAPPAFGRRDDHLSLARTNPPPKSRNGNGSVQESASGSVLKSAED